MGFLNFENFTSRFLKKSKNLTSVSYKTVFYKNKMSVLNVFYSLLFGRISPTTKKIILFLVLGFSITSNLRLVRACAILALSIKKRLFFKILSGSFTICYETFFSHLVLLFQSTASQEGFPK